MAAPAPAAPYAEAAASAGAYVRLADPPSTPSAHEHAAAVHQRDDNKKVTLGLVPGTTDHALTYETGRAEGILLDAEVFCYYAVQDTKILCLVLWLMRWPILFLALLNGAVWLAVLMIVGLLAVEPVIVVLAMMRTEEVLIRVALWIAKISAIAKGIYLVLWFFLDWDGIDSAWWWVVAALLLVHIILTAFPIYVPSLMRALVNLACSCMAYSFIYWDISSIGSNGFRISKSPVKPATPVPKPPPQPPPSQQQQQGHRVIGGIQQPIAPAPSSSTTPHSRHMNVISLGDNTTAAVATTPSSSSGIPAVSFNPQVIAQDGSIVRVLVGDPIPGNSKKES
jgi:hypothetical protein